MHCIYWGNRENNTTMKMVFIFEKLFISQKHTTYLCETNITSNKWDRIKYGINENLQLCKNVKTSSFHLFIFLLFLFRHKHSKFSAFCCFANKKTKSLAMQEFFTSFKSFPFFYLLLGCCFYFFFLSSWF